MRVGRALVMVVVLGAGLAACAFECIYIYNKGHKACGPLQEVVTTDRGGNQVKITEEDGLPPSACVCLEQELEAFIDGDPEAPELDGLHADIQAAARQRCHELAAAAFLDPTPCDFATLNEAMVQKTEERYEECKYLVGTIDEDKDGYCPLPEGNDEAGGTDDGGTDTDTGGTDTGTDTGGDSPIIPDLPLEFP